MRRPGTPLALSWSEFRQCPVLGQEAQAIPMKTALVPVTPQVNDPAAAQTDRRAEPLRGSPNRVKADFVAHLIATAVRAPQTRARRRAEPEQASAAYRSLGQSSSEPGRTVSRSL